MTKEKATGLARRVREAGGEASVYEGYSGRGMFGRTTTGVVMDRESARHFGKKHAHDSMGLDVIVY